jgi:hypothetical protein
MATSTIIIRIRIKLLWLLKAINIPLVLMGFEPCVPRFCICMETGFKCAESK